MCCGCLKNCCATLFCCKCCCKKKCGKQKKTNTNEDQKSVDPPRYVPDPTDFSEDEGSIYNGSDIYEAPRSVPIPVTDQPKRDNIEPKTHQLSLHGSALKTEQLYREKEDENKIFKVKGVIELDGESKEVEGTLKLVTDDNDSIKNYNVIRNITSNEQRRPDVVPIHRRLPSIQSNTSNNSSLRYGMSNPQDTQSIRSGSIFADHRRISSSYSIPSDDETVLKVRRALKRIPVDEHERMENIPMNTFPRRQSQNSEISNVSKIFNDMVTKKIPSKSSYGNTQTLSDICYNSSQEDYNEAYDHMHSGSSKHSKSSSLYNSSLRQGEELYGNAFAHRLSEHISLPPRQSNVASLRHISKRTPMPAPRKIYEEHLYEVII